MYTKEIENLCSESDNALEKIKKLKKTNLSYENLKENQAKFKYYLGINVEIFDCLFDYLQWEKDIEAVKKKKKKKKWKRGTKLRLNTHFENLADQGYWETTVHYIFRRWINPMHVKLKFLIKWPDHNASM